MPAPRIGSAPLSGAGQLRVQHLDTTSIVEADIDGIAGVDFTLVLTKPGPAVTEADFLL